MARQIDEYVDLVRRIVWKSSSSEEPARRQWTR
jgi:hypothetical protein